MNRSCALHTLKGIVQLGPLGEGGVQTTQDNLAEAKSTHSIGELRRLQDFGH